MAKKSLGQHFLKSERALNAIVDAAKISPGDTILEIGPGTGALTERLLQTGARVIAVEKDDQLYENLKVKYQNENFELIHDDILEFIENSKLKIENYKVVANIPYNITGAIFEKFLSADNHPQAMVLLVQKEVAKRIVDEKGSILSISVRAYGEPRYVETVKAGSFAPAPKVDSAIISINNISKTFFNNLPTPSAQGYGGSSEEFFFKILKAGFKSKRKKLISNLSTLFDKQELAKIWQKLDFDENLRAEELDINNWRAIAYLASLSRPGS